MLLGGSRSLMSPRRSRRHTSLRDSVLYTLLPLALLTSTASRTNAAGSAAVPVSCAAASFAAPVLYPVSTDGLSVVLGDFDEDGRLDAAVGGFGVALLHGNGDGSFRTPVLVSANI